MLRFVCKQEIMEDIYAEGLFSNCDILKFFRTSAKLNLDLDDHFGSGDIDYENNTTTAVRPDTGKVFFLIEIFESSGHNDFLEQVWNNLRKYIEYTKIVILKNDVSNNFVQIRKCFSGLSAEYEN